MSAGWGRGGVSGAPAPPTWRGLADLAHLCPASRYGKRDSPVALLSELLLPDGEDPSVKPRYKRALTTRPAP